jgi:hypothetical protein
MGAVLIVISTLYMTGQGDVTSSWFPSYELCEKARALMFLTVDESHYAESVKASRRNVIIKNTKCRELN